ncbi:MAG: xanthine dehydrogenase accessory protein XdhC [Pseudomonadota bacterium]
MDDWLAPPDAPAVLVTVAAVQGSAPRAAGAKMLVTAARQFDTIGGGHLELRAVELARAMLAEGGAAVRFERFALGPSLGQCCGGAVRLLLEPVDAGLAALLALLRARPPGCDYWRLAALDGAPGALLFDQAGALPGGAADGPAFARLRAPQLLQAPHGRRWLVDPVLAPRAHLFLFGAGHVGAALVRALAVLPCRVTWIDQREDQFPCALPANVTAQACDTPQALVADAPPGASYLVMSHSHALDQALSEAILARADVGWFGLIGSATKRARFEQRLRARGVSEQRLAAMVCPIGLPGIADKAPAVIAASVCAQLLMVWQAQAAAAERPAPAIPNMGGRALLI